MDAELVYSDISEDTKAVNVVNDKLLNLSTLNNIEKNTSDL
jgi:hypothetical protein